MATSNVNTFGKLSIISTLVDAAVSFARGRKADGLLLVIAAALSSRVRGLGTAVSIALRVVRRLR
ncbi:MAG: hypothetical protein ABEJ26_10670 [Halosimplex sp.]